MSFRRVASAAEIPTEGGLRVELDGRAIGIYRIDGHVYAIDDVCPHAGFPLSKGRVEGHMVVCPLHGWQFDVRDGIGGHSRLSPPLACFRVKIEDGAVWIDA